MNYSVIIPGRVYAGSKPDRKGWAKLACLNVHAIINASDQKDRPPHDYPLPLDIFWFCLGNESNPPLRLLVDSVEQAASWLQQGRVLYVHDIVGRNRLGFFVIALLMRLYGLPYEEARNLAKKKRPQLAPRKQFIRRLREYEKFLFPSV